MKQDARDRSKKTEEPQSVVINFGTTTRYLPVRPTPVDPRDGEWDDFDEILGNFGDWGDQ